MNRKMKFIITGVTVLFAFTTADLPLSKSYLPPASSASINGYPQVQKGHDFDVVPEVIAAKNLEANAAQFDITSTSFATNIGHDLQSAYDALENINNNGYTSHVNSGILSNNHNQAEPSYGQNSGNVFEKHLLEDDNEPVNYNFGYMVNDYQEGTDFGHHEERLEEKAQGEYHVVLPDGRKQTVSYQADVRGFKPQISYENSEEIARSGYDSNANNLSGNGYHSNGYDAASHNGNHDNGDVSHLGNGDYNKANSGGYY